MAETFYNVVAGLEGEGGAEAGAGVVAGGVGVVEAPQSIQTRLNLRSPKLWYG